MTRHTIMAEKSPIDKIRDLANSWASGTFEVREEESLIVGLYEGAGAFDPRNSIFIDAPYSDLELEEMESELNELIADTCFKRNSEYDTVFNQIFVLGIEADLEDPDLLPSLLKVVSRSQ